MTAHFDLIITADTPSRTAELRLLDEHGSQLAFQQTDFKTISVSRQHGLFDLRGYLRHYVQPRRALALREQLPNPRDRAISHNNLANYLERSGTPSDLDESPRHQLAALVYFFVAGLGQSLQFSLRNYANGFRRAQAAGVPLIVPRVAELLVNPAFRPLDDWLRQRQIDPAAVQTAVDQALEQAQQAAGV